MFKYLIYKFGQFWVNHLPLSVSYRVAMFISDMHYFMSFRDRRSVKANLRCFVNESEDISKLARQVFQNFGKYLVDFFTMARSLNQEYIDKNITIKGREFLDNVLSRGKGAILLTAHIGNWELGAVVISMLGYPIVAIALPHQERIVNDLFNEQRENKGVMIVPTNVAIRKCIEGLKDNKVVALVADRNFNQNGEPMDFLGKKAIIPKGPAAFSIKTGAAIVPSFLVREKDDRFTLTFYEPINANDFAEEERERLLRTMKEYTSIIEQRIREYPSQWLMFREFWIK